MGRGRRLNVMRVMLYTSFNYCRGRRLLWCLLLITLLAAAPRLVAAASDTMATWRLSAGLHAYRGGHFSDTISTLEPIIRKDDLLNDHALYFLGESYVAMGRYEEWLQTFETIIKNHPDSLWWLTANERAGDLSLMMERYEDALIYYRTPLLKRGRGLPRLVYKVSLALEGAGRVGEAERRWPPGVSQPVSTPTGEVISAIQSPPLNR